MTFFRRYCGRIFQLKSHTYRNTFIGLSGSAATATAFFGFLWNSDTLSSDHNQGLFKYQSERPVYAWGSNLYGIVAPDLPHDAIVKYPRALPFFKSKLKCLSTCDVHAAAIDEQGDLIQWGKYFPGGPLQTLQGYELDQVCCISDGIIASSSTKNKLYFLKSEDAFSTAPIEIPLPNREAIKEVSVGRDHLLVLSKAGRVYSGSISSLGNIYGQLGQASLDNPIHAESSILTSQSAAVQTHLEQHPTKPENQSKSHPDLWKIFTSGEKYSFAEKTEPNILPQRKLMQNFSLNPVLINGEAVQVACGDEHSLIRTNDGRVFAFGSNHQLQLGLGDYNKERSIVTNPTPLSLQGKAEFIAAAGRTSYIVVCEESNLEGKTAVYACGEGTYGQHGNNQWTHVSGTMVKIPKVSGLVWFDEEANKARPIKVQQLSAGSDGHTAIVMGTFHPERQPAGHIGDLNHGYDLYVWGQNRFGQLGLGRFGNQAEPISPGPICKDEALALSSVQTTKHQVNPSSHAEGIIAKRPTFTADQLTLQFHGQFNESNTLAMEGGQLQILPALDDPLRRPAQQIYCGPNVTFIY